MEVKRRTSDGIEIINNNDFDPNIYYLLLMEWNYPTESGRDVHCDTFDTRDEALTKAREYCRIEQISVKRHGHPDMKDLDHTWGPYASFGFTREDNPDKIGYMIVWENCPTYYFKVRIVRMQFDKEIPVGEGMYNQDDKVNALGRCTDCTHREECCYTEKRCEEC